MKFVTVKHITALLLAIVLCITMAACGGSDKSGKDSSSAKKKKTVDSSSAASEQEKSPDGQYVSSENEGSGADADPVNGQPSTDRQNDETDWRPVIKPTVFPINLSFREADASQDSRLQSNPERGWRTHATVNLADAVAAGKNKASYYQGRFSNMFNVSPDTVMTCYTYIYLTEYRGRDLPQNALDALDALFEYARKKQFTMFLTFAYCGSTNELNTCANQETMLLHIDNVAPIIKKNKDVIHAIKAGFIGAYGEMASVYQTPEVDYKTVITAIVEKLCKPNNLFFIIRSPKYKNLIPKTSDLYRYMGFGNDAIYGEQTRKGWSSDGFQLGTPEWEQVCNEGGYTMQDGEMCTNMAMHSYFNAETGETGIIPFGIEVIAETAHHRYSTMSVWHGMYEDTVNDPIMDYWKKQKVTPELLKQYKVIVDPTWFKTADGTDAERSCYEYLRDHLGYRISLQNAKVTGSAKPGASLSVSLSLKNYGFQTAFRMNSGFAILDSNYDVVLTVKAGDPEKWYSHNPDDWQDTKVLTHNIDAKITLPKQSGQYYLAFYLKNDIDVFARVANDADYAGGYNILCEIEF